VLADSNKQLQELVTQIVAAGSSGNTAGLADLSTQISKLAAVQHDDMTVSIATLATKIADQYAADPSGYDPTLELAELSDVSLHMSMSLTGIRLDMKQGEVHPLELSS
jgi:hypothetical protein